MKINTNNIEAMAAAISEAEGKARVRCLEVERVAAAVKAAEAELSAMRIPVAARSGCAVYLYPERVANSYRGIAEGTFAVITRGSKDWFLTSVARRQCGNCAYGSGTRLRIVLSDTALAAIPREIAL